MNKRNNHRIWFGFRYWVVHSRGIFSRFESVNFVPLLIESTNWKRKRGMLVRRGWDQDLKKCRWSDCNFSWEHLHARNLNHKLISLTFPLRVIKWYSSPWSRQTDIWTKIKKVHVINVTYSNQSYWLLGITSRMKWSLCRTLSICIFHFISRDNISPTRGRQCFAWAMVDSSKQLSPLIKPCNPIPLSQPPSFHTLFWVQDVVDFSALSLELYLFQRHNCICGRRELYLWLRLPDPTVSQGGKPHHTSA